MQSEIGISYDMNNALITSLESNDLSIYNIHNEEDYWQWLNGFVTLLYADNYYDDYEIPFS